MANNLITALKAVGAPGWLRENLEFEFIGGVYMILDNLYVKHDDGWFTSGFFTKICKNPERIMRLNEGVSKWN